MRTTFFIKLYIIYLLQIFLNVFFWLRSLCRILSLFPTLNENTICVVCDHCVYTSITPPHKWKAHFAFSGLVVEKNGTVQCPNGDEEDIPVGLVQYFNKGHNQFSNYSKPFPFNMFYIIIHCIIIYVYVLFLLLFYIVVSPIFENNRTLK